MNSKKIFHFFLVLLTLGLFASLAVGCNAASVSPTPLPTVTSMPSQTATVIPVTSSPSAMPTLQVLELPTGIPYPTASTVKANAVAFIERDRAGQLSLWVANVDGSGERKLTDITHNKNWVYDQMFQWSPDGKWISYFSKDDLWIVSPDGLTNKRVLSFPNLYTYVWSPDGSKIAYENIVSHEQTETPSPGPESGKVPVNIGIIDLITGETAILSSHDSNIFMPLLWSPDGKYLLFVKGFSFVFFDLANQKVIQEIERGCGAWKDITWSPNSKWFYHIDNGSGYYNMWICVSGLNGTSWRIEDVGVVITPPVWDKTGRFLYFVVGEMNLDIGPNWCVNQRLVRYDVETHKIQTLLSLEEDGPTGFPWSVSISPNGNMLGLYSYTFYEDRSHPGHIYIDSSRPQKNRFIILDIQSLSATKYTLEFEGEINGNFPPPMWSNDNQKIIFFLRDLVRESYGITYSDYGAFYSWEIRTGKVTLFSGTHAVENALVSPVVTVP